MGTVLDDIVAGVREDLEERRRLLPLTQLAQDAGQAVPALDALARFTAPGPVKLIAEVKRRSPSKGDLADIADPAGLAADYQAGGATAISVLTERRRFGGSLRDLDAVRERVRIPVLRKDFMVDPYQVTEARAHGADLILLIVAALDDHLLRDLHQQATALGMTALVEVHDEAELERAVVLGARLIGVNARNLKTLEVDPAAFGRLAPFVPDDRVKVAESGIGGPADVTAVVRDGASAVLVGEALVTGGSPREAAAALIDAGRAATV
ncbi:indole-3-glycerol phosphate synthase TrpC [Allobranchiibius sp. GilTou73]|uniref:indole-3-glycerol phosphate synthase TrpC n=1 Tax=Allobranchiibius sp. GilTou73 TaxID=2904523 RepID=UPI001F3A988A|nr:indole-3-glycerol phosphate synthase TrpC [Allobranchiibius sp. GilTou73]UIJ34110.1 indole-3-glycerol phosphate synthase TrpC [Allobranchiibius sp. GilTou73]